MIGKLSGTVDSVFEDGLVVDVNGVGYVVSCSARTLSSAGGAGAAVAMLIETQVREDAIRLFGFADARERDWFRLLQAVQGVGSKVALAILGVLGPDGVAAAIAFQDKVAVARAPGVGPRLAARIVSELKDRATALAVPPPAASEAGAAAPPPAAGEAVSAMANLGFARPQAAAAVAAAVRGLGDGASTSALVRRALAEAARI